MRLICFANGYQIVQAQSVENVYFPLFNFFCIFVQNQLTTYVPVGLILYSVLYSVALIGFSDFMPNLYCLGYYRFISFEIRQDEDCNFVLVFHSCFGHSRSFELSYKFWNHIENLYLLWKMPAGFFSRNFFESTDQFRKN